MQRKHLSLKGIVLLALVLAIGAGMLGAVTAARASGQVAAVSIGGLHVVGNHIVNSAGQVFRPLGVDRGGTEYMCDAASDTTVFDGPNDAASIAAIASWSVNTVRLPLNEDCWLGINGYPAAQYSAATYRQTIVDYVNQLNANNIAVIVDLHWAAPGTQQANSQTPMPDADHNAAFWTSVANTFKSNSSVIFDLFNEPYTQSWSCWLNGSTGAGQAPCNDVGFAAAGMQSMVNTVRATGATNVLMAGGLAYSNNLSQWLQNEPKDPLNNLAASFHLYNFNACSNVSCWDSTIAPVAAKVPVVTGELGENDCASGFINSAMTWFDQHGVGYLGWGWDTYDCSTYPSLITSYDGTPTAFGAGLKAHLIAINGGGGGGGPTPTPVPPTPTPAPGASCQVHYAVPNQWPGGFTGNITITNKGSTTIDGWTLTFTFPNGQQIQSGWNAKFSQQGGTVTVQNADYNATIAPNGTASPGFNASWNGNNGAPSSFSLNGKSCSVA